MNGIGKVGLIRTLILKILLFDRFYKLIYNFFKENEKKI